MYDAVNGNAGEMISETGGPQNRGIPKDANLGRASKTCEFSLRQAKALQAQEQRVPWHTMATECIKIHPL